MKKVSVIILFFTLILNLAGCSDFNGYTPHNTEDSTFITVESSDYYSIVYHKDTKVMYVVGGFDRYSTYTVMVDADGKPLLYEETEEEMADND